MGRTSKKVPFEWIKNERSRSVTFRKRKKGLMKKTYELNKLCDVQCAAIIYENRNGQLVRPETYPENSEEVKQIIERFVSKSAQVRKVENIVSFFDKQIMQVKKETAKLHEKNNEARYPSWDDKLNDYSSQELEDLLHKLEHKIEDVRQQYKQYALDQNIQKQTYSASGSTMYIDDSALSEEQTNLQALFQNNLYHPTYNCGSSTMNINCMPWPNYNIQGAPSTSSFDEQNASMKFENLMQYESIYESSMLYNQVLPQHSAYPMSASYLSSCIPKARDEDQHAIGNL